MLDIAHLLPVISKAIFLLKLRLVTSMSTLLQPAVLYLNYVNRTLQLSMVLEQAASKVASTSYSVIRAAYVWISLTNDVWWTQSVVSAWNDPCNAFMFCHCTSLWHCLYKSLKLIVYRLWSRLAEWKGIQQSTNTLCLNLKWQKRTAIHLELLDPCFAPIEPITANYVGVSVPTHLHNAAYHLRETCFLMVESKEFERSITPSQH